MPGTRRTVLPDILAARRRRVEEARTRVPLDRLEKAARERRDFRDFVRTLSSDRLSVIAELKKASPSAGVLRPHYRPRDLARSYESAGAAALSVLTEEDFFSGSLEHLGEVRQAVHLPVLRKDFILDEYQVFESVAAGADALLLIVAALEDARLRALIELARSVRVNSLVEVHTEAELARALEAGARVIGVNNRDLKTLEVDLATSLRLREKIPAGCVAVSESGIKTTEDLRLLADAGFQAVLIGERFMRASDPGRALLELMQGVRGISAPRV